MQKNLDKFLGVMFGGAIGDALGSVTEFLRPGTFQYVTDFQGRAKFRTKPGEWTDDTAMSLCLAQSLLDCNGCDVEDQLEKYLTWLQTGYMSSTGRGFAVGMHTAYRITEYKRYKEGKTPHKPREEDLTGKNKDGNGSIMRIGSIPLFYFENSEQALYYAGESVKSTHNTKNCILAAQFLVGIIRGAVHGEFKQTLLSARYSPIQQYRENKEISEYLGQIMQGGYTQKEIHEVGLQYGYVLDTLEIALWAFYRFDTFEEGLLAIINEGHDADTNSCVYGYIAGAYYGYDAIPIRRREQVAKKELIHEIALNLYNL